MTQPFYSAVPPEPLPDPKPGQKIPPKQTDPIRLRIEKAGRGGKTVTIASGFQIHPAGKEELLKRFKTVCGAGGTLKNGELEIQGEHRPKIKALLEGMGYRVKGA